MSDDRRVGSENALTTAMRELQLRGEETTPPLPHRAAELFRLFRQALNNAVREEVLLNGAYDVSRLLRLTPGGRGGGPEVFALTGGPKEFLRATVSRPTDHFVRDDGGVVHFSLEVRQNILNICIFVLKQIVEMQAEPDPAKLKSLIDINCNLAAGIAGRG